MREDIADHRQLNNNNNNDNNNIPKQMKNNVDKPQMWLQELI